MTDATPLRGMVIGRDTEQLVIRATEAEVARYALATAVTVAPAGRRPGPLLDGLLYDAGGQPVLAVTSVRWETQQIDVTAFGDTSPVFVQALDRVVRVTGRWVA